MTTTTKTQLLQAIITNPDEDTPRLVYADYLQENGEEDEAEYIRTAIQWYNITTVVMGEENAYELAREKDYINYIIQSPNLTDRMRSGEGFKYGLLSSIYGRKIVVRKDLDTHYTMKDIREWNNTEDRYTVKGKLEEMEKERHAKIIFTTRSFNYLQGGYYPDTAPQSLRWGTWERGFISEVRVNGDEFLQLAPQMMWSGKSEDQCRDTAHPVRKVTLLSMPDIKYVLSQVEEPAHRAVILSLQCQVLDRVFKDKIITDKRETEVIPDVMPAFRERLYASLSPKKVFGMIYPGVEFLLPPGSYPDESTQYVPDSNYMAAMQDYEQWNGAAESNQ